MNVVRPKAPSHSFSDGPYESVLVPTPYTLPTKNKKVAPVKAYQTTREQ